MRQDWTSYRRFVACIVAMAGALASAGAQAQSLDRTRDSGAAWQNVPSISAQSVTAQSFGAASLGAPSFGAPSFGAPSLQVPSWNSQPNAWRVGVAIQNTDTGVVLTEVEPNTPAAQAGLAPGDAIINVGGYQVGYVDGTLFDLGDEISRRADPQGHVTFMLFDQRNRRIRSLPMQLVQQSSSGVRGQILCRERITLSPQAVLTVRLRDVTFPSWQNVAVGQQVIPNPPHPPIPFSIEVDPQAMYPDHRYALDAWLVDRGQIVLQSTSPTPVTPLAGNAPLEVTLVRVGTDVPANSTYAVGQLDQVNQWYRQYLMRDATSQELAAWQAHLQAGRSPQDILAYILGSPEYYDKMGNQQDRYLAAVYQNINGRPPTPADMQQFAARYDQYGGARSQFVRDALRFQPNVP